ncbi:carbohydrate porin [Methylobacterium sp. E-005]|uniref:carbohydrate porin n=1 Tax=Methylobacterium sp. E-005 TaxID=2836549 RepID=UPI00391AB46F
MATRSTGAAAGDDYRAQIVPGWSLRPPVQYSVRPAGGIQNPSAPRYARIGDALVFGLRTTVRY